MRILIGHLLIILSVGQAFGQNAENVQLVEFSQSACDKTSDPYRIEPRIISLSHLADTLTIEIGFAAGCCLDFIPELKFSADTLYISYTGEKDECYCLCCYSFMHKIKGISSANLTVKLYNEVIKLSNEKYRTYPPTFVIVKGDTLNRKDKYGLNQGIWLDADAIQKIEADTLTPKDYGLKKIHWAEQSVMFLRYTDERFFTSGHLYLNLKVKDEYNPKTGIRQEFYRNGMIKRECHDADNGQQKCRQWDRNGREIK